MEETLEKALTKTEADAEAVLKTASTAINSIKKLRSAAHNGDLRELRKALDAADQAITALRQQFTNTREGWDFQEEEYLSDKRFVLEFLATAEQHGLKIFEQ